MQINYCVISLSLLIFSPVFAMDSGAEKSSAPIVIVGAVVRSNDRVGSPVLGRAIPLRYSRSDLDEINKTEQGKQQSEDFVKSIQDKIANVEATVAAVKALRDRKESQANSRKNLTRSTP